MALKQASNGAPNSNPPPPAPKSDLETPDPAAKQQQHDRPEAEVDRKWWRQLQTIELSGSFLLGVAGAIGHHFFYAALDGERVENQAWIVRAGTAVALAVRLLFNMSVGIAYAQRVWRSLRKRPFTLAGVNALFVLRNDVTKFSSLEVLSGAKVASALAALSWSLVLVPIIVPTSISVSPASRAESNVPVSIYTLNFSKDVLGANYNGGTPIFPVQLVEFNIIGASERAYVSPTTTATGFIYNTMYGKRIIEASSPCGANCSFTQTFAGPAYKCDDVDFTTKSDSTNPFCGQAPSSAGFGKCGSIFDPLYPSAAFDANWYNAVNSSLRRCSQTTQCVPPTEAWEDGKIWVAHQYLLPEYRKQNDQGMNSTPIPPEAWERHMFVCQSYNATYDVRRTYTNFQQSVESNVTHLNPINFTTRILSTPDPPSYAAFSIHQTLYGLLSGTISPVGRLQSPVDTTHLSGSALVELLPFPTFPKPGQLSPPPQKPVRDLKEHIQQLHINVTVGLLSLAPELLYASNGTAVAEIREFLLVWDYDAKVLLLVYFLAAALDLVAIGFAVGAMRRNGGASGFEFARVLATTRQGERLDEAVRGWENGIGPVPAEVQRRRILYGEVKGGEGRRGMAFNALD